MQRVLEPELMEEVEQVLAYAKADFEAPHNDFILRLKAFAGLSNSSGTALDLGCGPGDISTRFALAFPLFSVDAVDGSKAMIDYAKASAEPQLKPRLNYIHGKLPDVILPKTRYDIIFSNSLLHHLPDPNILWQVIKKYAQSGTRIIVMDLVRPDNAEIAKALVATYAATEPDILQRDFYCSLLAAFTFEEISQQLLNAGLPLTVEQTSDRHVFITGNIP